MITQRRATKDKKRGRGKEKKRCKKRKK